MMLLEKDIDIPRMKKLYHHSQLGFEKLTTFATMILSNSITFLVALITVVFWLSSEAFYAKDIHARVGDAILGVTFLSLFIIQKSFSRFSASLHLKVNELIASHETANNKVINAEEKTEDEIIELAKEYNDISEELKRVESKL